MKPDEMSAKEAAEVEAQDAGRRAPLGTGTARPGFKPDLAVEPEDDVFDLVRAKTAAGSKFLTARVRRYGPDRLAIQKGGGIYVGRGRVLARFIAEARADGLQVKR